MGVAAQEEGFRLVVALHQEVLYEVLDDLRAEAIVAVLIELLDGVAHMPVLHDVPFRQGVGHRIFFQEREEGGVDNRGGLYPYLVVEREIGDGQVVARLQALEKESGAHDQQAARSQLVFPEVDLDSGRSSLDGEEAEILQFEQSSDGKPCRHVDSDYERLVLR